MSWKRHTLIVKLDSRGSVMRTRKLRVFAKKTITGYFNFKRFSEATSNYWNRLFNRRPEQVIASQFNKLSK